MTTKAPSILIVEDEALVATEIEMILRRLGYRIAGTTRNGDEALDLLVTRRPDLALLDIHIKGTRSGIDLAAHIREKVHIPFVYLTAYSDRTTLREVGKTLPYGYIVKPFNERDLLSAIELALHKHASEQRGGFPDQERLNRHLAQPLTQREYDVLQQLDRGLTYQEVSDTLHVSINTVKTYQKSIFAKLGVSSRLECLRLVRKLVLCLLCLLGLSGPVTAQDQGGGIGDPEFDALLQRFRSTYRNVDTSLMVSMLDSMQVLAKANGSDEALGIYHFFCAKGGLRRGDYELARREGSRAVDLLASTTAHIYRASAHADLARYLAASGDYAAVFEQGQLAYEAAELATSAFHRGQALNTMAIAKRRMGDAGAAIDYFRRSLELVDDPLRQFSPIVNIAACFNQLGNPDSTRVYYLRSIELARGLGDRARPQLALALTNLSQHYAQTNQPERALQLAREAAGIFAEVGNPNQRLAAESAAASAYLALEQPQRALPHLWAARGLADQAQHLESQIDIYGSLINAHLKLSGADSLRYYFAAFTGLNDSLTARKRDAAMAEMETRFEVKQKEDEITRLELEEALNAARIRRQGWIIGLALLGLAVVGGFLWFVSRQRQRIAAQKEVIATSLAEKETLLKEIHHRVKNNLQMVSTLLSLQSNYVDDPSALDALKMGRSRVRSMAIIHQGLYLQDSVTPTVAADEYLERLTGELVGSYSDPSKRIELETDFAAVDLDIDQLIPLGLIANELITNAMKYAFQERDAGKLSVSLREVSGDLLMLRVADDGPGYQSLYAEKTDSFGSLLVRTLTKQLNGRLEVGEQAGTDARVIFATA